MKRMYCHYCGRKAELVDSTVIYGKDYGQKIWLCRNCNAYVGCHKGTTKPLGRFADAELRSWKRRTHDVFDPLWKFGRFRGDRAGAYEWLAVQMDKPVKEAHIGMFDVSDCKRAVQILKGAKFYG